jgi:hypothetical protein
VYPTVIEPANGDIDGINGTLYRIDPHVRLVIMLMLQLLPNTTDVRENARKRAGAPGTAPFVERWAPVGRRMAAGGQDPTGRPTGGYGPAAATTYP